MEGELGFFGTLTRPSELSAEWTLQASFMFPATGYVALTPEVNVLGNIVNIRFPVLPPAIESEEDPVISEIPVERSFSAPANAEFTVEIRVLCV
jgi:hypothetical protein